MPNRTRLSWVALASILACAGCGSGSPMRYITLDMTASGLSQSVNIEVDRFDVAEDIQRSEIMIVAGATEMVPYAHAVWTASLAELVQEKLEAEFGEAVEGRPNFVLSGTVRSFEQVDTDAGPVAVVRIEARLRRSDMSRYEKPLLDQAYEAREPIAKEEPSVVAAALSRGLERIAATILDRATTIK